MLCEECRRHLRRPRPLRLGELQVVSGLAHETVARSLVHSLKYKALGSTAVILGSIMARQLPETVTTLVPVPRALVRRVKYGIDPALVLARQIQAATGLEVVRALAAPLWWPSHAGSDKTSRPPPGFRLIRPAPAGSALIDDVVTTGATLSAAACVTGATVAITATRADTDR